MNRKMYKFRNQLISKSAYLLIVMLISSSVFAQSPQKMSYQAVIRDASSVLITSTVVGMQISILQGSSTGTLVYIETQTPTTNANGLVSVEIGGGTGFDTISWVNGPYFIKTETDPLGGTNYTITGTSQLLSVPFALHAKTAESITGTINETDPIFVVSPANGITNTNITNWNASYGWGNHAGLYRPISWVPTWTDVTGKPTFSTVATTGSYVDLINKPTTDGSETVVTAGTNINVTGTGTSANPYVINSTAAAHYIGENYGGGIIFWLDASGQHGLISAIADESTGINWDNGSYVNSTAFASCVGCGDGNTSMIVYIQGAGSYAAQLCYNLNLDGFNDWYLPSKYELYLMYMNIGQGNLFGLGNVGGFTTSLYWSSTEVSTVNAYYFDFNFGLPNMNGKMAVYSVRAVRTF